MLAGGNYWQWMEGWWQNIGPSDPSGNGGSSYQTAAPSYGGVSPDGERVPYAAAITDSSISSPHFPTFPKELLHQRAALVFQDAAERLHPVIQRRMFVRPHC